MKTSELIGPALDWAVAKCEGEDVSVVVVDGEAQVWSNEDIYNYNGQSAYTGKDGKPRFLRNGEPVGLFGNPMPSYIDWPQGGPVSEREGINTFKYNKLHEREPDKWYAHKVVPRPNMEGSTNTDAIATDGPTPLIAAMRCYVASKLGDEIEIPEELK